MKPEKVNLASVRLQDRIPKLDNAHKVDGQDEER